MTTYYYKLWVWDDDEREHELTDDERDEKYENVRSQLTEALMGMDLKYELSLEDSL